MTSISVLAQPSDRPGPARPAALRALLVAGCVLVVATCSVLVSASPGSAHADLVSSTPSRGATTVQPPTTVSFRFTVAIAEPAYVSVLGPDGSSVTAGPPRIDGAVVTQRIVPPRAGTYTMAYRVVAVDGHPVNGEMAFTVARGSASSRPVSPAQEDSSARTAGPAAGGPSAGPSTAAAPTRAAGPDTTSRTGADRAAASEGGWREYAWQPAVVGALVLGLGGLVALRRRAKP